MPDPLRPGDILLVTLGRHIPGGHEQEGHRPVVVVGVPERTGKPRFPMVVAVPLTTQEGEWAANSPRLYPRLDAGAGGLPSASIALLDNVRGVDAQRVLRRIGMLTAEQFAPIRDGLRRMLGLRK